MKISRKQQDVIGKPIAIISLLLSTFFAGFPILWMICSPFKLNSEILVFPPEIITKNFSFDTHISTLKNSEKLRFSVNSYFIVGMVATLILLVTTLASYTFSHYEFSGKKIISIFIISVQVIPPVTPLTPYFGLIVALKLYNTYQELIPTYMVLTLPYAIIMPTGYFSILLRELNEAAKVDGSTNFGALWGILVPISTPNILSVAIYTLVIVWNKYLFVLTLMRTDDMRTVPIDIQPLTGQHSYDWSEMMAVSVPGSIPVVVPFIFFQRYLIGGMISGSIRS